MGPDTPAANASTTEAVAADVASREETAAASPEPGRRSFPGENVLYRIGQGVGRALSEPYERQPGDPLYRPLRIYTVDPALPRLEGAIATVNVAFEPLAPGPVGKLFAVDPCDGQTGVCYRQADLDERDVLINDGYDPSSSDPRFHQQMVYAVCSNVYSTFKTALGRNLAWGFGEGGADLPARLVIRPHYREERNAYYENQQTRGELRFGYFPAACKPQSDRTMPGGYVFTCLSHDIIAHEVTHALLDGLRAHFIVPASADSVAFHEAFADLVAIFQHFSYAEVVLTAIRHSRGALQEADLLTQLASQFGHTTGQNGPLRSAIEKDFGNPWRYQPDLEAHQLGSVLVSAVFDAFVQVYRRKTERFIRLATGGSGVLPPGELPHDLQTLLAERASKLASQFLSICIRAIDYCPPVGMNFGDYLRAIITADYDLVPDDRWDYRGALIDAFWRRNIYPRGAQHLSEDALLWRRPQIELPPVEGLDFAALRFRGDPAHAASLDELHRQACTLGRYVMHSDRADAFGLVANGNPRLQGDAVTLPCVESIRSARRAGPNGQIVFDLIAEITQQRRVRATPSQPAFTYFGGATVILGPNGEIRYVVLKNVCGADRRERRRHFLETSCGQRYWQLVDNEWQPCKSLFSLVHGSR
ncbi:MAG: hypothetical protein JWR68_3088 [Polaromonas sp.]|nr:hypothetical protein [Polaromonas sp.]